MEPAATVRPPRVAVAVRRPAPGPRPGPVKPFLGPLLSGARADWRARPPPEAPRPEGTFAGPQSGCLPPGISIAAFGDAPLSVHPPAKLGTLTTLIPSDS